MKNSIKYELIGKCLYLHETKTLVIGDLHLGYEEMLHEQGILVPIEQLEHTINDIKEIFIELSKRKLKVDKVVMLGDIEHQFGYKRNEKFDVLGLFDVLRKYVSNENIIVIKGNHDTIDIGREFKEIYTERGVAFIHGDKDFSELGSRNIKLIIMGHEHPTIILDEENGTKREKFKCFLKGKFKDKEVIIMPSFLKITLGRDVLDNKLHHMLIDEKKKMDFEVFVVNENLNENALSFGKLKNL